MIPIFHNGRQLDLKTPLFVELINCGTVQDRMRFVREYGEIDGSHLPFASGPAASLAVAFAESLAATAEFLLAAGADEPAPGNTRKAFLRMTNAALLHGALIQPRLEVHEGAPRFVLDAPNLATFMAMELATAVEAGARTRRCNAERHGARCDKLFLYGPLTGRRSDREYCSNNCRLIALRARNAAKDAEA